MLRDGICNIVRQYLSVALLSENQAGWMDLENLDNEYVPVHYGFYNVVYQKKYFEAVYDEYTDISVIIFGGVDQFVYGRWPIGKKIRAML